jgi:hypothetical protein
MSTCNRLDLQTLGSQPIMPKNLPDHFPPLSSPPCSYSYTFWVYCDLSIRVGSHGSPSPKSRFTWSIRAISTVESMNIGTYHFTHVPSPKSQVHECLHGNIFLEVRLGTCVHSWVEQTSRLNLQHKSQFFLHKNQDLTLMNVNRIPTIS